MILKTLSELCASLHLSRSQLTRALQRKGAPRPEGKRYDAAEVAAWVRSTIGGAETADELKRARIKEILLRCDRIRLDMRERSAALIPRAFVDSFLRRLVLGTRNVMFDTLSGGLVVELTGMDDPVQIRRKLQDAGDQICLRMNDESAVWWNEVKALYEKEHPEETE